MKIRNMTVDDIPAVREIGDNAPELSVTEDNTAFWDADRLTGWIEANQDVMLVAEDDGEVVGFQITQIHQPSKMGYLSDLAVKEKARGNGIGSQLVKLTLEKMHEMGVTYVYALTQVKNDKIHNLLKKYNFDQCEKMIWFEARL